MEISGSYTLYAPRERVWAFLLDPAQLKATIPGCEELEQLGADRYRLRLNIGVAAVKGIYNGTLALGDLHPPESYAITVDGSGARGVLHGSGTLTLEAPNPNSTIVSYEGQAQIGGAIASLGSRMAQHAARTLINQFFARVADGLVDVETPSAARTGAPEASATPVAAQASPLAAGGSSAEWGLGIPEARPLGSDAGPTEAIPLAPAVGEPRRAPWEVAPAGNAPRQGHPAAPNPAPAFLTDVVRRMGLSDGSIESEQRIAWRMLFAVGGAAVALAVGLVGFVTERSRR
jgi:carbon monoxide dehydrogenase subunit G